MCLTTKQKRAKISLKPIECYKVIEIQNDGDHKKFLSPFQNTLIGKESLEGITMSCVWKKTEKITRKEFTIINGGVMHEYMYAMSALSMENILHMIQPRSNFAIFKCRIPAFTRYYISDDGKEIAAKRIKIIKQL